MAALASSRVAYLGVGGAQGVGAGRDSFTAVVRAGLSVAPGGSTRVGPCVQARLAQGTPTPLFPPGSDGPHLGTRRLAVASTRGSSLPGSRAPDECVLRTLSAGVLVEGDVHHLAVCTEDCGEVLFSGLAGNARDEELALVGSDDLSELDDDGLALLRQGGSGGPDGRGGRGTEGSGGAIEEGDGRGRMDTSFGRARWQSARGGGGAGWRQVAPPGGNVSPGRVAACC
eukprot:scaffold2908_cov105-Isochrysis_galbana.AAC.4